MSQFIKQCFSFDGMYLHYEGRFVARFKYRPEDAGGFRNFLMKNFTIEEYFDRLAAEESPLPIVQTKGYLDYSTRRYLHDAGFPPTQEGYASMQRMRQLLS